jgi:hypothetical protein
MSDSCWMLASGPRVWDDVDQRWNSDLTYGRRFLSKGAVVRFAKSAHLAGDGTSGLQAMRVDLVVAARYPIGTEPKP